MIELVPRESLRPSTYNPRTTDPARLEIVELSLRKLGFVLPVYADAKGNVVSGHQRLLCAERMGLEQVPVERVRPMLLAEAKAVNILFNRATNDLSDEDTPKTLTEALHQAADVLDAARGLPDSADPFPCLTARRLKLKPLLEANKGRWIRYAARVSSSLRNKGVDMPVVVTADLRIVNGLGRVQTAAERGGTEIRAVVIPDELAPLADVMLNRLSMDFDLETRYADLLRHNSFRRARRTRTYLGRGFVFAVHGAKTAKTFDIRKRADRARWIREHGAAILDFGAGHLTETELLRSVGIQCTPFEPYRLGSAEIDKQESLHVVRAFLEEVAAGHRWTSIFLSSVLNSVPFVADRRHIVTLCAALSGERTRLYAVASDRTNTDWQQVSGARGIRGGKKSISFALGYEPGIKVGEISRQPKVQKYHTKSEFLELFGSRYRRVKVAQSLNNIQAICSGPKPLDIEALREAIEFEFDLPYPDGSRMGLVDEAKQAFSARLGVEL